VIDRVSTLTLEEIKEDLLTNVFVNVHCLAHA